MSLYLITDPNLYTTLAELGAVAKPCIWSPPSECCTNPVAVINGPWNGGGYSEEWWNGTQQPAQTDAQTSEDDHEHVYTEPDNVCGDSPCYDEDDEDGNTFAVRALDVLLEIAEDDEHVPSETRIDAASAILGYALELLGPGC